ncbi:membrane-associated PAP2 superfamily phosphatase [Variovorax beijingensis]|uniref:Membrane-associated PAP2 superfamily phosphatase n=2 Tax=Variovorax TaxID=34072 RepID=A0AAE3Y1Y1_VARPD|nr:MULTISPECIES: phosphatase PAP2 family protein [Variovorax]MBD9664298.1 phosphatase PAP2 family protein [Variovorax sp. VRV01]MDP9965242.1 membrane-associated PAP2 superfamily phosphatase [Variovorax paradoxus]MDR6428324.1 membrane-associated PAP2 superfamily phosphatase [Variovorax paradoxus]MDR6454976.1 membrane-associated PAP2 superfamily phosphatase [Variovorax paradoxus]TWD84970.1 membrane-associated PAP2 superfamily phosphatase [Variovorax beijingensis]
MTRVPNHPNPSNLRLGALTFLALVLLLAWDATGGDLALARLAGTPVGFPWRDNAFLVHVMHEGAKDLSWLFVIALFAAIRWPLGVLRQLPVRARAQLAFTVLLSVVAISLLKHASHTSCPWDLKEFGGAASHVSHWAWKVYDGGAGGCFPAGHASAAFAYVGGYFVLRRVSPRAAILWLCASLAAGLLLGLSQQLRGAHYMSHTLWTAWICWVVGFAIDLAAAPRALRLAAAEPAVLHAGP